MRLDLFWIGNYKNLKDVTVDFDEDHWVTVVIGWNGTGKSNVLEALTILFRDLVMGKNEEGVKNKPSFPYKLRYKIYDKWWVNIDADPFRSKEPYLILIKSIENNSEEDTGNKITISKFLKDQENYLPKYIFGYYSGTSNRLEDVFRKYLVGYDKDLRAGKDPGLRRLFYALPVHSQFVLLAFVLQQDEVVKKFLDEQLGLEGNEGIDSVLFVLKQPTWDRTKDKEIFWGAKGVVRKFLDRLLEISLAPIRISRRVDANLWSKKTRGFRYLYLKDLDSLQNLVGNQEPHEFFRDLESTYVSELIEEVRIRVKLRKNDGSVTFKELSEGEQQLLTVLGLLKFTAEEESLFLLDEPDTHLNPQWCSDYLQHLKNFVGSNDRDRESSHIVLTTHNPLAVAELVKEQVQILKRDPDSLQISSFLPQIDPRGMGYSGIVTSDMFGLATAIDSQTFSLLEDKRKLVSKEGPLSKEEKEQLEKINLKLEGYGFRYEMRDPVFAEYLRARYAHDNGKPVGEKLSDLSAVDRKQKARKLIQAALAKAKEEE